jgi:hypothetical protein
MVLMRRTSLIIVAALSASLASASAQMLGPDPLESTNAIRFDTVAAELDADRDKTLDPAEYRQFVNKLAGAMVVVFEDEEPLPEKLRAFRELRTQEVGSGGGVHKAKATGQSD